MGTIQLGLGLLLPWLAGYAWLRSVEARLASHTPVHPLRQAGYGFFMGYAGLFGLLWLQAALWDGIHVWGTLLTLTLPLIFPLLFWL